MGLVEIHSQGSINDLADAHEMINWQNAGVLAEKARLDREKAMAQR